MIHNNDLQKINLTIKSKNPETPDIYQNDSLPNNETSIFKLIRDAWEKRSHFREVSDAVRIFHGFSEGIPGVNIEKFGNTAIILFKIDIRDRLESISKCLLKVYPFTSIVAKGHQATRISLKDRIFSIHGTPPSNLVVSEFGVKYSITPMAHHNVGIYLDARPVRRWLLGNSKNKRVLNLFAFSGSLGVSAKAGGAKSVIHIDKSIGSLQMIRNNLNINNLEADPRDIIIGDIYRHLPRAIKSRKKFDIIVLDPPPQVYKTRFMKHKPIQQDLGFLTDSCQNLLENGGYLVCLFHRYGKNHEEFDREVLLKSKGSLHISENFTSDEDFPETSLENKLKITVFKKLTASS